MVLSTEREIEKAYDQERLSWLRKRFFLFAWLIVGVNILGVIAEWSARLFAPDEATPAAFADNAPATQSIYNSTLYAVSDNALLVLSVGVFIAGIVWVQRNQLVRSQLIRLIYWLFVGSHLLEFVHVLLVALWLDPAAATGPLFHQTMASLFISHVLAAAIIPWTVREAVRPLIPLLILHTLHIALFTSEPIGLRVFDLVVLGMTGLPGMAVCWAKQRWFHRRFRYRAYRDAYHYVSREVEQARALHESFFPDRVTDGPLLLDYHYQPMSQLGGDYLHAHVCKDDQGQPTSLLCAVIDVTGHGLPATLTANHLHALLKRQMQTQRLPDPGDLLTDLNRYMHESFSGLSVFATAIVMRLDLAEERVIWASAGHPPAFLVSEGRCEPALESTCCLLGVLEPEHFQADARELALSENVSIVAYTDGASELPLVDGDMLGINGFAERVGALSQSGALNCRALMQDLAAITTGERQDDILLVQLALRPVAEGLQPAPDSAAHVEPLIAGN